MSHFKFMFIATLLFIITSNCIAQQSSTLPHSTPEAQGVSAKDISAFVDAASHSKTEFHSFMLLRHGKVIAEGWWNPYRADLKHTLYSCSKSFTATAIGFAVQEKKLSLNDKVISFFPNELPDTVSHYLSELTVKDVLMMSDGQSPDPTPLVGKDSNWIKGFLATPIVEEPGTTFLYNSLGTYMLSAIVQKVTGQKTIDYLSPRLFAPLGIQGADWETDTKGINTGGWGLRLKTEDMAKFAQLFLQSGKWNGKQIISADWVKEASTMKIMQDPSAPQSKRDSSDWLQGYCYQMWRCRNNAFRGDGAFGQFMIVMPDKDVALAITAETADMQSEINLVWQYLLPAFKDKALPADAAADDALAKQLKALTLPAPSKSVEDNAVLLNGKTFLLDTNKLQLQKIAFHFANGTCSVAFSTDKASYSIPFNNSNWNYSQTNKPGPSLLSGAIENTSMIYPARIAAAYIWKDANTLQLILRYIESPHTDTFTCYSEGDKIRVEEERSEDFGKSKTTLQGKLHY